MSRGLRMTFTGAVTLAVLTAAGCSSDPTDTVESVSASTTTSPVADDGRVVGEPDSVDDAGGPSSTTRAEGTEVDDDASTTSSPQTTDAGASTSTTVAGDESTTTSTSAETTTTPDGAVAGTATTTPATTTDTSDRSTTTSTSTTSTTTTTTTSTTTTTTSTTAAPASFPDRIALPAEVASTEGIAADPATGRLFVGELNGGNVWSGTPTGTWSLFNSGSAAGRSTAFGLAVDAPRNRLYVVSGVDARVDVLNLSTGNLVTSIAVPVAGGSLINDVTVAPDGTAYVTDTGAPRLYRIAAGGNSAELWVDYSGEVDTARTQHGNGVVANGSVVLVAYMERGELLRFDRSTGAVTVVAISGATTAGRDGLVVCGNRLYGVEISSITGMEGVWVTDLNGAWTSGTSAGRIGAAELSGASTAAALDGHLVVVNAQFGVSPKTSPYDLTVLDSTC